MLARTRTLATYLDGKLGSAFPAYFYLLPPYYLQATLEPSQLSTVFCSRA